MKRIIALIVLISFVFSGYAVCDSLSVINPEEPDLSKINVEVVKTKEIVEVRNLSQVDSEIETLKRNIQDLQEALVEAEALRDSMATEISKLNQDK